jgi:large subunit ribosomal protein L13
MSTNITIDAAGKKLGRIASQAAAALRGKNTRDFAPNRVPDVSVRITNAGKVSLSEKKARNTQHTRYSGYPGGFKTENLRSFIDRRGHAELFRRTVSGMLPRNKLRAKLLKRLRVEV